MTSVRRFSANDLFRFASILSGNLARHVCNGRVVHRDLHGLQFGFFLNLVLGKAEGEDKLWHGHVTALTVAPEFRRMGLASKLMNYLEDVSENIHNAYFVDLFVRCSNTLAIKMYEKFGYTVYRRVLGYYTGLYPEDALDMRRSLKRDVNKESMIPLKHPVRPEDLEWG